MSGGSVKPANKKFSSVRNDYTLHFDEKTHVDECSEYGAVVRLAHSVLPVSGVWGWRTYSQLGRK